MSRPLTAHQLQSKRAEMFSAAFRRLNQNDEFADDVHGLHAEANRITDYEMALFQAGETSAEENIASVVTRSAPPAPPRNPPPVGAATVTARNPRTTLASQEVGRAIAQAAAEEKSRCHAITTSEEGRANPAHANHLAFDTDITVDQALAELRAGSLTAARAGWAEAVAAVNGNQPTTSRPAAAADPFGWNAVVSATNGRRQGLSPSGQRKMATNGWGQVADALNLEASTEQDDNDPHGWGVLVGRTNERLGTADRPSGNNGNGWAEAVANTNAARGGR